jgi:hypothetical protein
MTTITATARNYTATLDRATGRVSIADDNNMWAGDGQWNGNAIVDCPAVLGGSLDTSDEIYDELDSALSDAVAYGAALETFHGHMAAAKLHAEHHEALAIYRWLAMAAWQPGCRPDEVIAEMSAALDEYCPPR